MEEKAVAPVAPAAAAPVAAVLVEPEEVTKSAGFWPLPTPRSSPSSSMSTSPVNGSGPSGRITATDVEAAAGKTPAPAAVAAPAPAASAPAPAGSVAFTSMQAGVARNMVDSMTVPTFHVGYTITTDALDALYKKAHSSCQTLACSESTGLMPFCPLAWVPSLHLEHLSPPW